MASAIASQILLFWRLMHFISGGVFGLMLLWSLLEDIIMTGWKKEVGRYLANSILILVGFVIPSGLMHVLSLALSRAFIHCCDPTKKKIIDLRIGAVGSNYHLIIKGCFDLVALILVPVYIYVNQDDWKFTWFLTLLAAHFYLVSLMGIILRRGFMPFYLLTLTTLGIFINVTFTHKFWTSFGIAVALFVLVIVVTQYFGERCLEVSNQIFTDAEEDEVGYLGSCWCGDGEIVI